MAIDNQVDVEPTQVVDDERYEFSRRARLAKGQPIGKLMAQALKFPDLVSLAAGFVDNATLPCQAVEACLRRICENDAQLRRALQYDATAGNIELRKTISEWSYKKHPECAPDPERIILTSGSNQFLHLFSEAIIDPGDIVITAAPTYFVFLGTLKGVDAQVIGVHADQDGICPQALEAQLRVLAAQGQANRVKAIYTVTDFDNPAGSTLSLQRRHQLVEIVARWRREFGPLFIISDNAYQQLRYSGDPLPALSTLDSATQDYVIELGTFSKSFSPGIRVGWGVVPEFLVERLLEMKSNVDFGSPHFSQVVMQEAITGGDVDRHLPQIRASYKLKLEAMLEALEREFGNRPDVLWRSPQGGLYVWVTLPPQVDTSEAGAFWAAAVERGVLYVPGHYCYPEGGQEIASNTMRLSFGVQDTHGIEQGIRRLADALDTVV